MSDHARIVDHLLEVEGWPRYVDQANDRGGPTKGGITLGALADWRRRRGLPAPTRDDLRALEEPEARKIYEVEYIVRPGFERVADDLLRLQLVDAGVLHGVVRVVRWLQEALPPLHVDGDLGSRTGGRVNDEDPHRVALLFAARRHEFLGQVLAANYKARRAGRTRQDQAEFAGGWARRAASFVRMEAAR